MTPSQRAAEKIKHYVPESYFHLIPQFEALIEAEFAPLIAATQKISGYAGHDEDCEINTCLCLPDHYIGAPEPVCTCGYSDAVKELRAVLSELENTE